MYLTETSQIQCPYCGETIEVVIDRSLPHQNYIEDCQVCCRPIVFDVTAVAGGEVTVLVSGEDE
jgi:hypothetical protein